MESWICIRVAAGISRIYASVSIVIKAIDTCGIRLIVIFRIVRYGIRYISIGVAAGVCGIDDSITVVINFVVAEWAVRSANDALVSLDIVRDDKFSPQTHESKRRI